MLVAVVFSIVLAADQATKALVGGALPPGSAWAHHVFGVRIRHLRNTRPGVGIVLPWRILLAIWILSGCALTWLLAASGVLEDSSARIGLGLVLGGTLGNLIDRAARGAVIDFIDLRVWPVFNVADGAIVVGTSLVFWSAVP